MPMLSDWTKAQVDLSGSAMSFGVGRDVVGVGELEARA